MRIENQVWNAYNRLRALERPIHQCVHCRVVSTRLDPSGGEARARARPVRCASWAGRRRHVWTRAPSASRRASRGRASHGRAAERRQSLEGAAATVARRSSPPLCSERVSSPAHQRRECSLQTDLWGRRREQWVSGLCAGPTCSLFTVLTPDSGRWWRGRRRSRRLRSARTCRGARGSACRASPLAGTCTRSSRRATGLRSEAATQTPSMYVLHARLVEFCKVLEMLFSCVLNIYEYYT